MAKESVEAREEKARNTNSQKELEKLAEDENEDVRRAVAINDNTPVSLLEKLAEDINEDVRSSVASNDKTPLFLL